MLVEMIRDFAKNEIIPIAQKLDESEEFPKELVSQMSELGLMGIPIPKELGGAGMDMVAYAAAVMELAKADAYPELEGVQSVEERPIATSMKEGSNHAAAMELAPSKKKEEMDFDAWAAAEAVAEEPVGFVAVSYTHLTLPTIYSV